jgi:hypothetical protein
MGMRAARTPALQRDLSGWALCVVPLADAAAATAKAAGEPEVDAVRLYAGDSGNVLEIDLLSGRLRSWWVSGSWVTGLAAADDGARLFVAAGRAIAELDTRTGAMTTLLAAPRSEAPMDAAVLTFVAVDRAARALLVADYEMHCIQRLSGIRP